MNNKVVFFRLFLNEWLKKKTKKVKKKRIIAFGGVRTHASFDIRS